MISLYNINLKFVITETESVYCAVRTESLYIIQAKLSPWKCSASHYTPSFILVLYAYNISLYRIHPSDLSVKDFCVMREFV